MQFINLRGGRRGRLFIPLSTQQIIHEWECAQPRFSFLQRTCTKHVYLITIISMAEVCSARRSYYTNFSIPLLWVAVLCLAQGEKLWESTLDNNPVCTACNETSVHWTRMERNKVWENTSMRSPSLCYTELRRAKEPTPTRNSRKSVSGGWQQMNESLYPGGG